MTLKTFGSSADVDRNLRRPSYDLDEIDESEDTQEASEVETQTAVSPPSRTVSPKSRKDRKRPYNHRLNRDHSNMVDKLKQELQDLIEKRHPDYIRQCAALEQKMKLRLQLNTIKRDREIEMAEKDYEEEIKAAKKEFDEKKEALKTNIMHEVEERRNEAEVSYQAMKDVDSFEIKLPQRMLRRRAIETPPVPERRRGKISLATCQINLFLDEKDVEDDLRAIARAKRTASLGVNGIQTLGPFPSNPADIKIEDGKLLYEKKWFLRGQTVYVEGKHMAKFPAIISNIGTESVQVKKTDSTKLKILLHQLIKGSVTIKRRAS